MKYISRYKYEICIVLFFVLSRLPALGHDFFNTDVWKWKTRSYDFGSGIFSLDFAKTNQKYHPGVTLMWLGTFAIKVFNVYYESLSGLSPNADFLVRVFGLHFVQKLFVVLTLGITLVFLDKALEKLFNRKYALICLFLISFEPFYIALSRVFHLEGLLATFMLTSAVWLYLYFKDQNYKRALFVSGFFGGLAFLTKTSAVYLLPFVALVTFMWVYKTYGGITRDGVTLIVRNIVLWLVTSMLTIFVLWPALWVDFSNVAKNLYRGIAEIGVEREHYQYYFGSYVDNPGISYYIVVLALRSSPYLLLGVVGALFTLKKAKNKNALDFVRYLLIFSFFYIVQHTIPAKKLDRYVLPALIGLLPISAFFFEHICNAVAIKKGVKVLIFLVPLLIPLYLHPDYFSYYNPLFGGIHTGIRVIEPKWMIGQRKIVKFFKELSEKENIGGDSECPSFECVIAEKKTAEVLSIGFPEKYYTQIHPFIRELNGWAIIKDLTPFAKETSYFVYPVWEDDSELEDRFKLEYIGTVKVRGAKVYNVYESY